MSPRPTLERRVFRSEFRDVPGSSGRQKWATAVTYDTTDEYGTLWRPHSFDEALGARMPTILYGHDWYNLDHVLGSGIDWRQTPADVGPPGVDVLMEFADVPAAELAMRLLAPSATSRGPVLRDVSVGFLREEWATRTGLTPEEAAAGASEAMIKATMDELSLVIRGAVSGAQVRGRRGVLDLDAVVEIARRKANGELTDAEAQAAVGLLAGDDGAPPPPPPEGDDAEALAAAAAAADAAQAAEADLSATLDAALDVALGRSRH